MNFKKINSSDSSLLVAHFKRNIKKFKIKTILDLKLFIEEDTAKNEKYLFVDESTEIIKVLFEENGETWHLFNIDKNEEAENCLKSL